MKLSRFSISYILISLITLNSATVFASAHSSLPDDVQGNERKRSTRAEEDDDRREPKHQRTTSSMDDAAESAAIKRAQCRDGISIAIEKNEPREVLIQFRRFKFYGGEGSEIVDNATFSAFISSGFMDRFTKELIAKFDVYPTPFNRTLLNELFLASIANPDRRDAIRRSLENTLLLKGKDITAPLGKSDAFQNSSLLTSLSELGLLEEQETLAARQKIAYLREFSVTSLERIIKLITFEKIRLARNQSNAVEDSAEKICGIFAGDDLANFRETFLLAEYLDVPNPLKDYIAQALLNFIRTKHKGNFELLENFPHFAKLITARKSSRMYFNWTPFVTLEMDIPTRIANRNSFKNEAAWREKYYTTTISDLSQNQIVHDTYVYGTEALREIRIWEASIGSLLGLMDVPNIYTTQSLCLINNKLVTLPDNAFSEIPGLVYLNLEKNRLVAWNPSAVSGLISLTTLILSENHFTNLPADAFPHPNLVVLKLARNAGRGIETIHPDAFRGLSNLEELDLSDNQLSAVNLDWFNHLPKLKILNMKRAGDFSARAQRAVEQKIATVTGHKPTVRWKTEKQSRRGRPKNFH